MIQQSLVVYLICVVLAGERGKGGREGGVREGERREGEEKHCSLLFSDI